LDLTTAAFWGGVVQKEEQRRNSVLADLLFISRSHPLAAFVFSFYDCYGHLEGRQRIEVMKEISPVARYGFKVRVSGFWFFFACFECGCRM
jgi:5'-3' exoribonuclease 2